ncbi:CHAT domain-containing protein [Aeoliella sp. ICT_H6.2]|uniref:CHAT domain-containing protein n=1 Tax=Aeoliella straminimaris TaxID=2954799 RepID=A0A9X2JHV1_9BACT|nr:CHAT domain-containing protein [Aeoliella straminimaris]MCO6043289.1 CHAT domain-containing protein [Aeoliella straminimaris]
MLNLFSEGPVRRHWVLASAVTTLLLAGGGWPAQEASAQDRTDPGQSYFATIEQLYRADHRDALRGFRGELRGGIRVGLARWVDSICYRAMLGETYYQMGYPREALAEFDAACELFLTYPRWLLSVRFQNPRVDSNVQRRIAPWGTSTRRPTYGIFSDTMLVTQGEFLTENRVRQGGALQSPQFWRLNVIEVMRATALSIRRRNEILGPLGKYDRTSKDLVDALARGGNTARNHWSNAWTGILLGLAQQGVGESQQALANLSRSTLVDGRFDHPLTGVALLAQAQVAMESGNAKAALGLATEASYAGYAYDDYDVLASSFEMIHRAWMAGGNTGAMPALATAANWADRKNLDYLAAICLTASAEELVSAGDANGATNMLRGISARRRDLRTCRIASERRYVEAFIAYLEGNIAQGDKATAEAVALEATHSLRHHQIVLTNERIDSGQVSSRVAVDLYALLLRDPASKDWASDPLEVLVNLSTSYEGPLRRWLLSALSRDEILPAIDIADITKRRRFWSAQPVGGRLLAIRNLLEADPAQLPPDASVEHRNLMLRVPEYKQLLDEAADLHKQLEAEPLADGEGRVPQERYGQLKRLAKNAEQRETLVRQLVLRRDPTALLLPPAVLAKDLQQQLKQGQAVIVFHQSANSFFAFILTQQAYHHWQLPEAGPLAEKTVEMLRTMGHFTQNRELDASNLAIDGWAPMAKQFGDMLFAESRLDLASTTELIIVPDGILWHAPIEPLMPSTGGNKDMIIDRTPVRYVPTLGWAAPDRIRPRPIRTTLIAASSGTGAGGYLPQQALEELAATATGSAVIDTPVAVGSSLIAGLAEQAIVLADATLDPTEPYNFTPVPLDRSSSQSALSHWLTLPLPDCQRLLLGGVHTAAETGLKSRGRGRNDAVNAGPEMFQAHCALLASGAKTVLMSRWQTSGKTHRDLLREMTLELPHTAADQAWRRSVALARRTDLDAAQEPRYRRGDEGAEPLPAEHPFFWSGYILVDTGFDPTPPDEADAKAP